MKKRLLALMLALAMALCTLTGCGTVTKSYVDKDPALSGLDSAITRDVISYLTDGAIKHDDVAMTVNGEDVKADFYFYWIGYLMTQMEAQGLTADMLDDTSMGDPTISEYLHESGTNYSTYYTVLRQMAAEEGIALGKEDNEQVKEYVDSTEPAMMLYYATTEEAQKIFYENYLLSNKLMDQLYGEGSENAPTEEDLLAYADETYFTCRYILFPTHDSSGNEIDAEKQKKNCQKVYDELKKAEPDKLEEAVKAAQEKWNAEDGADGNTDPYTFSTGSVVEGFETTARALQPGELGMTQEETSYGYFIILRQELDLDDSVKEELRSSMVGERMDAAIQEKTDAADVEVSEAFENLDTTAFCTKLMELQKTIAEAKQAEAEAEAADASAAE